MLLIKKRSLKGSLFYGQHCSQRDSELAFAQRKILFMYIFFYKIHIQE